MTAEPARDHGGGIDAAAARYGGTRGDWIDLSTGINPVPFPLPPLGPQDWTALPDRAAQDRLIAAARAFWAVPDGFDILPAPGASVLIAQAPYLVPAGRVHIPGPTYNEHAAAFGAAGWILGDDRADTALVVVHPNNPTGRLWTMAELAAPRPLSVLDESFADVIPGGSLLSPDLPDTAIVLKSFGKFWGLAGLRLGFAIARPALVARLRDRIGPWAVSGPALRIGAAALSDRDWADRTRARLAADAARLDALALRAGLRLCGGTDLFRLYDAPDAAALQDRLAKRRIWTRIFPYSTTLIRFGLPAPSAWDRVEAAL